jgi:periplasmic divalent cation tolerance protein
MTEEVLLVFTTWPSVEMAREAARMVVEEGLAACANLVPAIESIYRWEGKVETAGEVLVIFKTTRARYAEIEARIQALHPYEVPEIVGLRVEAGLPGYLRWVAESLPTRP